VLEPPSRITTSVPAAVVTRCPGKLNASQPVLLPVMSPSLTMPLIACGASPAGDETQMAYLPLADVIAELTTVTGPAFGQVPFGQALSHTLIPLTGLPVV